MAGLIGYNFFMDGNAVDPTPSHIEISNITLLSGEIEYLYVTEDTSTSFAKATPSWDSNTVMYPTFNNTLNGGIMPTGTLDFTKLSIVRNDGNGWKLLRTYTISSLDDLEISFNDTLALQGDTKYAFLRWNGTTKWTIANLITELTVKFANCQLANSTAVYPFKIGVKYTNTNIVNPNAVFEPIGRKYPIYVSNASTNYQSGGITARYLDPQYLSGGLNRYNRNELRKNLNAFTSFITTDTAKIYQDWNGNAWLIMIHDNQNIDYIDTADNAFADVQFNYVEIGDITDLSTWVNLNLISEYYTTLTGE